MNSHATPVVGDQIFTPDYNQAYAWASALTGDPDNAVFNWRFIHDQDKGRAAIKRRGTLLQMWQEACQWNANGYGIFATVNEMDGFGDTLEHVAAIRAHVVDLDNLNAMQNLQRAEQHLIKPQFIVQTSPNKAHVYWLVTREAGPVDLDGYRLTQRKLRQLFEGDPAVIDAARVLRVPGFWHRKGAPHLVTVRQSTGYGAAMPAGFVAASVAHVNAVDSGQGGRHPLGDPALAAPSRDALHRALALSDPNDMDRAAWIAFTAGWKQAASTIMQPEEAKWAWLLWCTSYANNDPAENEKQWDSITETQLGWKSLLRQNPKLNAEFMFGGAQFNPATLPVAQTVEQLKDAAFAIRNMEDGKALLPLIGSLTEPEQESVLHIIADKTGTTLRSWKRTLKNTMQDEIGSNSDKDHSQIAERTLIEIGRDNLIRAGKDFWKYNGSGLWRKVDDAEIRKVVQKVLKAGGHPITHSKTTSIANVLADMIHVDNHEFNAAPKGTVNCPNGELTFLSGLWFLNSHVRTHYRTTQIPVSYDYGAPEPVQTLKYLRECFQGDDDAEQKIEMLFALAGYAIMDHADHAKFLILKGQGRNGKSVWMHILENLVGEKNTANVQPAELHNRFQLGELDNKLLNIVDDLPKKALLPDGVIKAIVAGGKITGEHKQRDPFSVSFRCFLTIGTNYDLPTVDDSTAMMERAVIIEWNRTFRADERDDTLRHRLVAEELPAILKRALDAYGRALLNGFPHVPSSDRAKEKWLGRINPVRRFIDQEYEIVPDSKILFKELWLAFQTWEQEERSQRIGRTRFAESLAAIPGVEKRNDTANHNHVTVFGLRRRDEVGPVVGYQPQPGSGQPGSIIPFRPPGQMPPR
ncbi:hypothetical protein DTW92_19140 [Paracoccus pantotrophus]|uniref:phage/plasmid primase, P4 family n=1 Tax=Paracoccus pantotrophus TaxID=82367 RepID=UPI000E09C363|nr:phage/plasmid primase, P4 family [Paracoccus pantotrophus]RDD93497.1 hypothetical protein DTW92_19140 [Paracoccus pantotrophus]WGR67582.1 hypothetical protein E3U24_20475 [Paracoccus pantotrophus]